MKISLIEFDNSIRPFLGQSYHFIPMKKFLSIIKKFSSMNLVNKLVISVFVLTPTLFCLGLLLEETRYISLVSWLVGIVWCVFAYLILKHFLTMIKNLIKWFNQ